MDVVPREDSGWLKALREDRDWGCLGRADLITLGIKGWGESLPQWRGVWVAVCKV